MTRHAKLAAPSSVFVVTGATNGLGLVCARRLAASGRVGSVVLACRNVAAARALARTPEEAARFVVLDAPCDLASLASVRAYAAALRAWLGPRQVAALVNNAGVGGSSPRTTTADGFETIFQSNHLGHFLLTVLLLPALAPGARVVNVSSEVHDARANKVPLPDPGERFFPASDAEWLAVAARGDAVGGEGEATSGSRRYTRSKLLNVMFTHELARRLSGAPPRAAPPAVAAAQAAVSGARSCALPAAASVTVVAMNPGLMLDSKFLTGVAGSAVGVIAWLLSPVIRFFVPYMRTMGESGAVLADIAEGRAGGAEGAAATAAYFDGAALKPSSYFSRSELAATRLQQDLWRLSCEWARVTPEELAAAGFK